MFFGLTSEDVKVERGPPVRLSERLAVAHFYFVADSSRGVREGIEHVTVHDQGDDTYDVRFTGHTDGAYVVERTVLEEICASLAEGDRYGQWKVRFRDERPDWVPDSIPEGE
ncbi:hypothetical protein [Halopelagius longus]|uniref:Uncharacterized protein n=1 Tax=Halopelagius longus TaxID=1236180 RepID=A0A1H1D4W5_9EURY|nr:hypothetical protein [Halopelagius longus]RDI71173.1 hypothetical protein DWB78_05195 [Halopelagius longus]SDQ71605.1 hypothetical protein SAMN05216278_2234 [Halopelagius longus]